MAGVILAMMRRSAYVGDMSDQARWNFTVSRGTDTAVREVLASLGRRGRDLPSFVEEAVRARIVELTAEEIKRENAGVSADEMSGILEEALEWARRG